MARGTQHGEIWWASTDKRRPVLIASRDDPLARRQRVTCATITSTVRGIPSEVVVGRVEGLAHESAINCDDLFTMDKGRLIERIGRLSPHVMEELDRAIGFALGLTRRR